MDVFQGAKVKAKSQNNRRGQKVYKQLLTNASHGITFSEDVIMEMGPEAVPYSKANFHCLYDLSGPLAPILKQKSKKKRRINTHHSKNEKGILVEEIPLLPPVQASPINPLAAKDSLTFSINQDSWSDAVRRTGLRWVPNVYSSLKQTTRSDEDDKPRMETQWDEFVLKKLTKTTAKWIVSQQIPNHCMEKLRLQSMLRKKYGTASVTDLVNDDCMQEKDFCSFLEPRKPIAKQKGANESQAETPLPVYYRMQGYSLPTTTTNKPGGVNQTAGDVLVKRSEPPQTPKLPESLNTRIGECVYHTDNNYQQELYLGIAKPVHQRLTKNPDRIIMDNNSEYQKHLQDFYPCGPQTFMTTLEEVKTPQREVIGRTERGLRRWVDLPTSADYATEIGLIPPDNGGLLVTVAPKQKRHYEPMIELSSLRYAVEEWRSSWMIKTTWQSVTIEGLKRALTDMHYHVRLGAIATCASGAVSRPRQAEDPINAAQFGRSWDVHPVPPELLPLIVSALDDPVRRVQMAAAVCHYAMGTPDPRAREILRIALHKDASGLGADSWLAAQCLAMEGEASQAVIQRILSQHFVSEAKTDKEQAASLLSSLSSKTTLVRSLLAEKLNCLEWKTRVLACETTSQLKGPINKDLVNKLIYLMWNDWNNEVRQRAAQALGKLGMGRQVHNELSEKLEEGPGPWRVEALVLIGQLRIMTAKLLPPFLLCLNDSFVAVRKQGCHTAGELEMKDSMVMNQLLHLMQNDSAPEVKVAAIAALANIGCLSPRLLDNLLWALHHEVEPMVRVAACQALLKLRVKGPELQQVLQERFALEPNLQVLRHIEVLLKFHGYKLEGDKGMVLKIKDQVQKLCTKDIIIQKVMILQELESLQKTKRKLQGPQDHSETSDSLVLAELLHEQFKGCKPAFLTEVESPPNIKKESKYLLKPEPTSADSEDDKAPNQT